MADAPTAGPPKREAQDYEKTLGAAKTDVAAFEDERKSPLQKFQGFLHDNPTAAPAMVLVLSCLIFGVIANNFFSPFNLSLIIQQVTVIGILGAAQTLVILTAGIDLSVAAIMVLSYMVMARLAVEGGVPAIIAVAAGLGIGVACGLLNGSLVTRTRLLPIAAAALIWIAGLSLGLPIIYVVPLGILAGLALALTPATRLGPAPALRLPPFIVTLGAWSIFFALNLWYSEAQTVRSQDIDAVAPLLKVFGLRVGLFGAQFTMGSFLMVAIFIALWYALGSTGWGRAVYAVGDDKESAELSGIPTDKVLVSVYGVAGFLCALGGWAAIGRVGSASPQSFYEGNLDAITAVVIGGTSLFGGRGAIFGTLIGALIVGVFRSGLKLAGVDVLWQTFAVGLLIIVAVAMDQWIRRVSA
jgi:fructose transport system permease protein